MAELVFEVTGMSCGHCENAIKEELQQIPGVREIAVSAATGELTVQGAQLRAAEIIAAVAEAGYTATLRS